ncbi:hypothetical protein COP2_030670 [Malus domestica]
MVVLVQMARGLDGRKIGSPKEIPLYPPPPPPPELGKRGMREKEKVWDLPVSKRRAISVSMSSTAAEADGVQPRQAQ